MALKRRTVARCLVVSIVVCCSTTTSLNAQGNSYFISDSYDSDEIQLTAAILQDAPAPTVTAPSPAPQSAIAPSAPSTPTANRPNVASFGRGQFNTLTRSPTYISPVALSLGVGGAVGTARTSAYFGTAFHRNLLKTPEMFGDFRRPYSSLTYDNFVTGGGGPITSVDDDRLNGIDFPSAGAFSGMRVSENNVALPQDRVWTSYHHFHNAFQLPTGDLNLDRFIIGFEKTFDDGASSLEFRLPISGSLDPEDPFGNTAFAGGSFGEEGFKWV